MAMLLRVVLAVLVGAGSASAQGATCKAKCNNACAETKCVELAERVKEAAESASDAEALQAVWDAATHGTEYKVSKPGCTNCRDTPQQKALLPCGYRLPGAR